MRELREDAAAGSPSCWLLVANEKVLVGRPAFPEFDAKFGMSQTWYHFLHGGGWDRDI
jgi:hypothetical protein